MRSRQPWAGRERMPEPWDTVQEQTREEWQRLSETAAACLSHEVHGFWTISPSPPSLLHHWFLPCFPNSSVASLWSQRYAEVWHRAGNYWHYGGKWVAHLCSTSGASPCLLNTLIILTLLFLRCLLRLSSAWVLSVSKLWTAEAVLMHLPGIKSSP